MYLNDTHHHSGHIRPPPTELILTPSYRIFFFFFISSSPGLPFPHDTLMLLPLPVSVPTTQLFSSFIPLLRTRISGMAVRQKAAHSRLLNPTLHPSTPWKTSAASRPSFTFLVRKIKVGLSVRQRLRYSCVAACPPPCRRHEASGTKSGASCTFILSL